MCVCVFVCDRQTDTETERLEREGNRSDRMREVCVGAGKTRVCAWVCMGVCLCVCLCVCVCVRACVCARVLAPRLILFKSRT